MGYSTADARQQLLDTVAEAADELGFALASLGEAYERLDERTADDLERELFRPLQMAYGRAQRTHTEFANRHDLPSRTFEARSAGAPSLSVKDLLENATAAIGRADTALSILQDSMLPVEVGDPNLRAGLEEVRTLIGDLPGRARQVLRTVGR
jgi:hypothetical protein